MNTVQFPAPLLAWTQISQLFEGEWVLLSDCRWGSDDAHPRLARVVSHSPNRAHLMTQAKSRTDDIVIFVQRTPLVRRAIDTTAAVAA